MGFRENLREALDYSGLEQKELAHRANVKLRSIENYLRENASIPMADKAVQIAQALGVSVEYLVTGRESMKTGKMQSSINDVRIIARLTEQLDAEKRKFVIDFIKWLKART